MFLKCFTDHPHVTILSNVQYNRQITRISSQWADVSLKGKTTFIRMLAGLLKSDEAAKAEADGDFDLAYALGVPEMNVRYVINILILFSPCEW